MEKYDFRGWATRNNIRCADGRIIRKDAFLDCDGKIVPLVWNHQHNEANNILGHALLKNTPDGVLAYGKFNDTESGRTAKQLVDHGDICALSIFANQLREQGPNVLHGMIKEVSLVLAGANPGAYIEDVIAHGEASQGEAYIYFGDDCHFAHGEELNEPAIEHAEKDPEPEAAPKTPETKAEKPDENDDETVADVFNTLTEKQKTVVYALVGQAIEDATNNNEEDKSMKQNLFDQPKTEEELENTLSHSEMMAIIDDSRRYGSMKESALQHGIEQIDYLFPDAKNVTTTPQFIQRDMGWVTEVMNGVHRSPFSRIKSIFADITEDEARAKGYIKGKMKKEEVFSLLKRSTTPTTVYKKQKMDRDDVVDITDFDVVAWLKTEMRMMLNEELARAFLIGDGRLASSDDKINEQNIRPIWKDEELFTIKARFKVSASATADDKAKAFIRAAIKFRKDYRGSGNPVLFMSEDILTDCLLLTDEMGRDLYDSVDKLAMKLRVRKIVPVPIMDGLTREESGTTYQLFGLMVNLNDYGVGADKGGAVNMFDDFDIDYNAQKYLIETRCSGALTKPYSAMALELDTTNHLS